jgi:hypothetical protein
MIKTNIKTYEEVEKETNLERSHKIKKEKREKQSTNVSRSFVDCGAMYLVCLRGDERFYLHGISKDTDGAFLRNAGSRLQHYTVSQNREHNRRSYHSRDLEIHSLAVLLTQGTGVRNTLRASYCT